MFRPWRALLALIGLAAISYAGVCALMFFRQESLVYFPIREYDATPAEYGLPFERVTLTASDGATLAAWWIPVEGARGAVVVAHGNGGNISHRLGKARLFSSMGLSTLLFDYRGYGGSGGEPSEAGTYADMAAAVDHVIQVRELAQEKIVLYGESLGGAVAVDEAGKRAPGALVVESSFTSLPDVAAHYYPWLPVRLLLRYRYDSKSKIASVKCPVLVLHSPSDEIIPYPLGRALFDAAKPPKRWADLSGGHNDGGIEAGPEAQRILGAFLDGALGGNHGEP